MKKSFKFLGISGRDAAVTKWGSLCNKLQGLKLTGRLILILIIGFGVTACPDSDIDSTGKTALPTPAGVNVVATDTSLTLVWNAVEGADSYTVDTGTELKSIPGGTTSFDLKPLTADPKVYPIRVRAVAYSGDPDYFDSAYSEVKSVEIAEYIFNFEDDEQALPNIRSRSIMPFSGGGKAVSGLKPYGKTLERVVVPSQIGSAAVTAIAPNAFADGTNIMTSVSLPDTIITIGAGAFTGTSITDIVIPESVLTIGNGAFANCIVLVVVVFVSVEPPAMGDGVFEGVDSDNISIVVPEESEDNYRDTIEEAAPDIADRITTITTVSISVTTMPSKTTYFVGDTLDTAGIVVTAAMSDSTTHTVTTGLSYNPTHLDSIGPATITVTYLNFTATFTVTVNALPSGGTDPVLNGTWSGTIMGEDWEDKIDLILNNGTWDWKQDGVSVRKGTYTASGGNMTYTTTLCVIGGSVTDGSDPSDDNQSEVIWGTRDEAIKMILEMLQKDPDMFSSEAEAIEYLDTMYFISGTGTYNATTLNLTVYGEAVTFTKKGTTGPGEGGEIDAVLNGTWKGIVENEWTNVDNVPCNNFPVCGGVPDCPDCKWEESSETFEWELTFVLNNGVYEMADDGITFQEGNYSTSGGKITLTPTLVYSDEFVDEGKWYTREEMKTAYMTERGLSEESAEENTGNSFDPTTFDYSISNGGNTLEFSLHGMIGFSLTRN